MLGNLPFHFDRPGWLVLLVLVIPVFLLSRRSIGGVTLLKAWATFAIRCVVMLMLTIALARPVWEKRGEGLTVTVVLDRSQSIPLAMKDLSLDFLRDVTENRADPRDRLALITVARGAKIDAMPGRLNETWFRAEETGVFYGQCSELCGKDHTYMPIVVEVVSQEDYDAWVQTRQAMNGAATTKLAAAE